MTWESNPAGVVAAFVAFFVLSAMFCIPLYFLWRRIDDRLEKEEQQMQREWLKEDEED